MGRRAIAWGVDFGLMMAVAAALGAATYQRMLTPMSEAEVATAVWAVVSSGGDIAGVAADFGAAVWRAVVRLVLQAFGALVLVQLLYQFLTVAFTGRTLGKMLVGVRVVPAGTTPEAPRRHGLPKGKAFRRAVVTTLTDTGLFAVACCALLTGQFLVSVVCWLIAVVAFWGNALPALARRRTVADVVAGTRVVRGRLLRTVTQAAHQGGQATAARLEQGRQIAADGLQRGRQTASEAFTQGRRAAVSRGQQVVRGARELANHERVQQAQERVQQALTSERAQQVRQVGQQAAARGGEMASRGGQMAARGAEAAARGLQALRRMRQGQQEGQRQQEGQDRTDPDT